MTATYAVIFLNGAAPTPTQTAISSIRFRTDDNNTADLTNPCKIKNVLTRSFWKGVALQPNSTFTQVSNFRHYCDGAIGWTLGTLGKLKRGNRDSGDNGCPLGSYVQATGVVNSSGDNMDTNHTYYSSQTVKSVNIQGDTSSSPALIDSTPITVAGTLCKHIVMQVEVDIDAVQGVQGTETLSWLVDEI